MPRSQFWFSTARWTHTSRRYHETMALLQKQHLGIWRRRPVSGMVPKLESKYVCFAGELANEFWSIQHGWVSTSCRRWVSTFHAPHKSVQQQTSKYRSIPGIEINTWEYEQQSFSNASPIRRCCRGCRGSAYSETPGGISAAPTSWWKRHRSSLFFTCFYGPKRIKKAKNKWQAHIYLGIDETSNQSFPVVVQHKNKPNDIPLIRQMCSFFEVLLWLVISMPNVNPSPCAETSNPEDPISADQTSAAEWGWFFWPFFGAKFLEQDVFFSHGSSQMLAWYLQKWGSCSLLQEKITVPLGDLPGVECVTRPQSGSFGIQTIARTIRITTFYIHAMFRHVSIHIRTLRSGQ